MSKLARTNKDATVQPWRACEVTLWKWSRTQCKFSGVNLDKEIGLIGRSVKHRIDGNSSASPKMVEIPSARFRDLTWDYAIA